MLSLNSLALKINNKLLFDRISMSFLPSSIVYLTGYNGIGKTSLLRIIAGIQKPSKGHITFGRSNVHQAALTKPYCLYLGHLTGIKNEMTVLENIIFWSKAYNSSELIEAAVKYFSLEETLTQKCYELSAGNKKKLALSRLLSCKSNLWLLDEVYANLDQMNSDLLTRLILAKADSGGIVFITTHDQPKIKSAQILNIEDYSCRA